MLAIIKLTGFVFIFMGIAVIIKPAFLTKFIKFCEKKKRIMLGGIVRLALGLLFLLNASSCKIPEVVITFGIIVLLQGILMLTLKQEKVKAMLDWWNKSPLQVIRLMGIVVITLGWLLICSV